MLPVSSLLAFSKEWLGKQFTRNLAEGVGILLQQRVEESRYSVLGRADASVQDICLRKTARARKLGCALVF